jgi:hypothetical protein
MKDYRVTIKVRNNRILTAIAKAGGEVGGKWCFANGLTYTTVNSLINMTVGPLLASGNLSGTAERLCEVLNCLPEDLWSNEQLYPLEKNFSEFEMSHEQIMALTDGPVDLDMSSIEDAERKKHVGLAVSLLPQRQQEVLRLRFTEDMTLGETGAAMGVTRERVRQIEQKALRNLRNPKLAGLMAGLLPESHRNLEELEKAGEKTRMLIARGEIGNARA